MVVREKRKEREQNTSVRSSAFCVFRGQITCLISVFICVHLWTKVFIYAFLRCSRLTIVNSFQGL